MVSYVYTTRKKNETWVRTCKLEFRLYKNNGMFYLLFICVLVQAGGPCHRRCQDITKHKNT